MSHEIIDNSNAISILPAELLVEILSYLPEEQLNTVKRVCKNWLEIIEVHLSLYGKFLSMQRWHDSKIDKTLIELEKFKNTYTIINYSNIYLRGNFDTKVGLYSITLLCIIISAVCMGTLYYLLKLHGKRTPWEQAQNTNKMQQVKYVLNGLTAFTLLSSIVTLVIITRRERNTHQTLQVIKEILEKLKALYMKERFFLDELPDASLKHLFFHPRATAHTLPTNQQLNQKISDDYAKLPQLKYEIASHANTLVKQTTVNRNKVSSYCLKTISLWNQTHPRRQIPVSESSVTSNISQPKCKPTIQRRAL